MKSINFDTGYKSYIVNGDENSVVKINVSDLYLPGRMAAFYDELDRIYKEYKKKGMTNEEFRALDKPMREKLNETFGLDISTPAFGAVNCMSILISGSTVLQSFLDALMPIISDDVEEYRSALIGKYLPEENAP